MTYSPNSGSEAVDILIGILRLPVQQNAPISHTIAPAAIKTTHPYPPYAQEEIVAPEVTSDFLG